MRNLGRLNNVEQVRHVMSIVESLTMAILAGSSDLQTEHHLVSRRDIKASRPFASVDPVGNYHASEVVAMAILARTS
jgi:hypothetical protein